MYSAYKLNNPIVGCKSAVDAAGRFQLFLSCTASEAQLWFQPHRCMWVTLWSLLPSLPQSTSAHSGREGRESLSWRKPFQVSRKVGSPLGRQPQWRPHPLHITQQWGLACLVVPTSSMSILGCRAPHFRHLRLAPGSQRQSSLLVCFPNPKFQHPAPVHTSRHVSGWSRLCRFVCPACHLLCSPPSFRSPPSAQLISLPVRGLPHMQEPPLLQLHLRECRSHPTSSSFSLLSFYLVMWGCAILPLIHVSF